jgi:hypothetical protein
LPRLGVPELSDPAPDSTAWRDARYQGAPAATASRLLLHPTPVQDRAARCRPASHPARRAATTIGLLAECFETLGGVPKIVLADRMGCLKGGVVANLVVPTPDYVRFATITRSP